MCRLLTVSIFLSLVILGVCKDSSLPNCQFLLTNDTDNDDPVVCVRMNITAEFNIEYKRTIDETTVNTKVTIPVDCNAAVSGYCSESINGSYKRTTMELTWGDNNEYILAYTFIAKYDKNKWNISEVSLSVDINETFNNVKIEAGTISGTRSKDLIGDINFNESYYCDRNKKFDFTLNSTENNKFIDLTMSAEISEFKVQAFEFNNATSGEYQDSTTCPKDVNIPLIIGVSVGCAVLGLIIVLVVAYFVGHFRNTKKSYEILK